MNTLYTLSNKTKDRLDQSYFSVLERTITLKNTITSMREIAGLTKDLNEVFKDESEEVVREIETSLTGLVDLEAHQQRIEALAASVQKGRQKIKTLADRVDVVKDKVDAWERSELDWQERTRKRLKVLWIIMAVCGLVFLGFMAG